jgi:hypothetical protein
MPHPRHHTKNFTIPTHDSSPPPRKRSLSSESASSSPTLSLEPSRTKPTQNNEKQSLATETKKMALGKLDTVLAYTSPYIEEPTI